MHGRAAQIMSEQDVQTYITWTHGAQPTWLQFHGPGTLLDRPIRQTTSPPPPPRFPILLPPPPHSLCPQCVPPRTEDNPALPHRNRSAHNAGFTALTIPVMMIHAVLGRPRNALEQHPLQHRGFSATLHRVSLQASHPSIAVPIGKLQALLSCLPTSWSEMSFSMCS